LADKKSIIKKKKAKYKKNEKERHPQIFFDEKRQVILDLNEFRE
jgi:hypothetical protein